MVLNSQSRSVFDIMKSALDAFERFGYNKAGIRDIASKASVSLGLVNHHFKSKKNLGIQALGLFRVYIANAIEAYAPLQQEPLLNDTLAIRVTMEYLLGGRYRQFYLDTLQEDLFFDSLIINFNRSSEILRTHYCCSVSRDIFLLYNHYAPYSIEKTLLLKKEEGMFANIPYDDIPFHISAVAFEHFVPREDIAQVDKKARELSPLVLAELPAALPDAFIAEYLQHKMIEAIKADELAEYLPMESSLLLSGFMPHSVAVKTDAKR